MKFPIFLILLFLGVGSSWGQADIQAVQLNSLPTFGRDDASGFSIGEMGFICCGSFGVEGGFQKRKDLWQYDRTSDQWLELESLPGDARQYAMSFSDEHYGYILGGQNSNTFFDELWRYDLVSDSWEEMNAFPGGGRAAGSVLVFNGFAYVGTGRNENEVFQDFWKYELENDLWSQLPDFPGGLRFETNAFFLNGKGHIGMGRDESLEFYNDLWTFDPNTEQWTEQCNSLDELAYSKAEIADEHAVFFAGQNADLSLSKRIYAISSLAGANNLCEQISREVQMEERRGISGFTIGNSAYFFGGLLGDNIKSSELYRVNVSDPFSPTSTFLSYYDGTGYIFESLDIIEELMIYSVNGQLIRTFEPNSFSFSAGLEGMRNGIYIIRYGTPNFSGSHKLLIVR